MKIVPLKKLVAEYGIEIFRQKGKIGMKISCEEYAEVKDWFIKGNFTVDKEIIEGKEYVVLNYECLEKDITVTINRPMVNGETIKSTDEEILHSEANKLFYVRLLHAPTGRLTATLEVKRGDIPRFIRESILKFTNDKDTKNFFVIRVNFDDRTVDCDQVV